MTTVTESTTADLVQQIDALRQEVAELRERTPQDKAAIIVFSARTPTKAGRRSTFTSWSE